MVVSRRVLDHKVIVSCGIHTHTHTCLTALCPGQPGLASTTKIKPIWILLEQEIVSGSGIIAHRTSLQAIEPCQHLTTQFLIGRMPFLMPNQQCQSTEGTCIMWQVTPNTKLYPLKCWLFSHSTPTSYIRICSHSARRLCQTITTAG